MNTFVAIDDMGKLLDDHADFTFHILSENGNFGWQTWRKT